MATVTVELRTLIEQLQFKLFDFTYAFDDPTFKSELEQSITDFYYDYEIGFETPDMFKRKFQARWNRIIPIYNEYYNTTVLEYNPLQNLSITEVLDGHTTKDGTQDSTLSDTRTGSTTTDGTHNTDQTVTNDLTKSSTGDNKTSDYPQQPIAGGDYLQGEQQTTQSESDTGTVQTTHDLTDHLTASSNDTSNTTGSLTNNNTEQTNNTKTTDGIQGTTYQALIQAKRDLIINIKQKVIDEMKPCFILTF
jgi:hypothetical protein